MKEIKIQLEDGSIINCPIQLHEHGLSLSVKFENDDSKNLEGEDLFECLQKLREDLEKNGCKVLCNGARVDAYPSGMCRDMGMGKKVYLQTMGKPALGADLVETFDYAEPGTIGTIQQQTDYHEAWLRSLKD